MMMTIDPATILLKRFCLGKYGSSSPVIGFLVVMGAMAVNWGRGRSLKKRQYEVSRMSMWSFSCTDISPRSVPQYLQNLNNPSGMSGWHSFASSTQEM